MPHSFTVLPDTRLSWDVDAEARFNRFPSDHAIKGMFLSRIASLARPRVLEQVRPKLVKAPALGRYLPFADYPQVDYSRLAHGVAVDLHPNLPVPEAMRRLARHDIETFAGSQVGKVMLAFAGDAESALEKLPEMYRASLRGGRVSAERRPARTVVLRFEDFPGWVDCYPIGTVEGVAVLFGRACEVELTLEGDLGATYVVRLR